MQKTGLCVLMLVSMVDQSGVMVEMDARYPSTTFKQFNPSTNFKKILGIKLSLDEELQERMND